MKRGELAVYRPIESKPLAPAPHYCIQTYNFRGGYFNHRWGQETFRCCYTDILIAAFMLLVVNWHRNDGIKVVRWPFCQEFVGGWRKDDATELSWVGPFVAGAELTIVRTTSHNCSWHTSAGRGGSRDGAWMKKSAVLAVGGLTVVGTRFWISGWSYLASVSALSVLLLLHLYLGGIEAIQSVNHSESVEDKN